MTKQDQLQEEAINKMVEFYKLNNEGYLDLAMRFGKCRVTIEFLKRKYRHNAFILIAYPDNKLKDTWIDECKLWGYSNPRISYINFSSLKKADGVFDFVVLDEWHSLSENEMELAKKISEDSLYTLCLSGTTSTDTKERWPELKQIHKFSTNEGIEQGILADYQITVHLVNLDSTTKTPDKKGKLKTEKQRYDAYTWVINKNRDQGLPTMHLALARNRLSLSSIGKMNYVKNLLKVLKNKRTLVFTGLSDVADNMGIPSYHSKSKNNLNYLAFQEKHVNHLALAAMGKVGVTYPDLDSVILLNFTYNAEESAQILNRAIKLDYHGKVADLHVICLNEPAEVKKIKESLSMLDQTKIKYV